MGGTGDTHPQEHLELEAPEVATAARAYTHAHTHARTCTPWAAWEQGAPQSDTQLPQRLTGDQQDKGTMASSSGRALGQTVGKGGH